MFDCQWLRQTQNQGAPEVGAGGFMFTTAEHNVVVVQSVTRQPPFMRNRPCPHSPNVEILRAAGASTTAEEAESHCEMCRSKRQITVGLSGRGTK